VGLDSEKSKLPKLYSDYETTAAISLFNQSIVSATKDLVCAYKPNTAFYESHGPAGWRALLETIEYINKVAPSVPVILDAKRADIHNTNEGYVQMAFDCYLKADAITINPYLGREEANQRFLDQKDKGIIVLCRTSNKGAKEFQDLEVRPAAWTQSLQRKFGNAMAMPLYQYVAHQVATEWNVHGNCMVVVGATYPEELAKVRYIVDDLPILIPGIGAQGGDLEKTVFAGQDSRGQGIIVNSSRGIIFASNRLDFADAARRETERLHNLITQFRQTQRGAVS